MVLVIAWWWNNLRYHLFKNWSKTRLRIALVLFFLALTIPTIVLIQQASRQMKWEAFHQQRTLAEELVKRIDRQYLELLNQENARAFTDYTFLNVVTSGKSSVLQRSPLSAFPPKAYMPGVIGYFQIDSAGHFSSPLLPASDGPGSNETLSPQDYKQRLLLSQNIQATLSENKLLQQSRQQVEASPLPSSEAVIAAKMTAAPESQSDIADSQAGFDQLQRQRRSPQASQKTYSGSLGKVENLKLKEAYSRLDKQDKKKLQVARQGVAPKRSVLRKERNVLPGLKQETELSADSTMQDTGFRINIFESEIDAHEFSMLDSGHFVLFRKVWRGGQRYIQGILIESGPFLASIIGSTYSSSIVSNNSNLLVAYQGNVLSVLDANVGTAYQSTRGGDLQGTLLLKERLSSGLEQLELIFSVSKLPVGPGGAIINWLSIIIMLVLCGGFLLIYRLGLKQIHLTRQQQDFVSAVSHELKTPLTSIRMYGEMLREGWVSEQKKQGYYDYIYEESERLSRLINNVLQLARMTRNDIKPDLKQLTIADILSTVEDKVKSNVDRNGFLLNIIRDENTEQRSCDVDIDYLTQIFINLTDNAIKFVTADDKKQIDIGCRPGKDNLLQFYVRDYGPGIEKDSLHKIFHLFYRPGNELTRTTSGTGIGLALVKELIEAMRGSVDVVTHEHGAEFRLLLKAS